MLSEGVLRAVKDKKNVSIVKSYRPKEGILSPEDLEGLSQIMKKHGVSGLRLSGGALELVGPEQGWEDFCHCLEKWLVPVDIPHREAKACRGMACRNGMRDAPKMAGLLWEMIKEMSLPGKIRIGVSACPNNCAGGPVKDLGLFATARGWTVMAGGSAGRNPRLADRIASGLDEGQVMELADRVFKTYAGLARPGERPGALIRRSGPGIFISLAGDEFRKDN